MSRPRNVRRRVRKKAARARSRRSERIMSPDSPTSYIWHDTHKAEHRIEPDGKRESPEP